MTSTCSRWSSLGVLMVTTLALGGCNDVLGIRDGASRDTTMGDDAARIDSALRDAADVDGSFPDVAWLDAMSSDGPLADGRALDDASTDVTDDVRDNGFEVAEVSSVDAADGGANAADDAADAAEVWTCTHGYKLCGARCVSVSDPTYGCTKDGCSAEGCPAHAETDTLVCSGNTCVIGQCGKGTKDCGGLCVPTDSNHGCEDASSCAACRPNEQCAGAPSSCACVPDLTSVTCPAGACGARKNNCGQDVNCGACTAPQSCGGGGTPLVCGCTAKNPCDADHCGPQGDGCGGVVNCPFNACGGCGTLPAPLGGNCTSPSGCSGSWFCSGTSMVCNAPSKNQCGGCDVLPGVVGGDCTGSSGCRGTYACSGTSLVCNAPAKNLCGQCAPTTDCNYCMCTGRGASMTCGYGAIGANLGQTFINVTQSRVADDYRPGPDTGWTCFQPERITDWQEGANVCYCPSTCGFGGMGGDLNSVFLHVSDADVASPSRFAPSTGWRCGALRN